MTNNEYICRHCHYTIQTGGPWPYRKDEDGDRVLCTDLGAQEPAQILGLVADMYCPTCDAEKRYVMVKYKQPLSDICDIWSSCAPRKVSITCRKCGEPLLLAIPPEAVNCPRCQTGSFEPVDDDLLESPPKRPVRPPRTPLVVRQRGRSIPVPRPTVIIDSAEHMGYTFCRFSNWFDGSVRKRLKTGDYSLVGFEDEITIERKTLADLVNSIITDRYDFIQKCERMSSFPKSCIVVEAPLSAVKSQYEWSHAQPNAVLGSLVAAQERWSIPVYFLDDSVLAEEFVASMLSKYHAYRWLETNGYDRCLIEGDI